MKKLLPPLFVLSLLSLSSCGDKKDVAIVTQKYVHKYGYAVSKAEWDAKNYPGQVVTTLRDGVTIVASYENGQLNGPTTQTFPQSQTIESYKLYNKGVLTKEVQYNSRGLPKMETVFMAPAAKTITLWFESGSPLSIEEYSSGSLIEGQYFTPSNETESRVVKGKGVRSLRDAEGILTAKEQFENSSVTKRETFFTNGVPESITFYQDGKLTGERHVYNASGEPEVVEHYQNGLLSGLATYFKNGCKFVEVSYKDGEKHGDEIHFIDGKMISQRISWQDGFKHGASSFFVDGTAHTHWFHKGNRVGQNRFDELCEMDERMQSLLEQNKTTY